MYKHTLAALALLGAVTAQNSTVVLPLLNVDQQPIVASIVGSDADATTYVLSCPTGTDASDCGLPDSFTVTEGPSTLHFATSDSQGDLIGGDVTGVSLPPDASYTGSFDYACKITGSSSADCTLTASASYNGTVSTTTDSTTVTDASDLGYVTVTVTAGSTGASTTGSSSKSSSKSGASSETASGTAGGKQTSNPAMPAITAKAQWALGGAAAALAYAAM